MADNQFVHRSQIEDLISLVSRESTIRTKLDSMKEQWQVAELDFVEYKSKGFIYLHVRIYLFVPSFPPVLSKNHYW
jgi:hypothetical protein